MPTCSTYRLRPPTAIALLLVTIMVICSSASGQDVARKKVVIGDDAALHYVERGGGEPIIFVHGLLDEYSSWLPQLNKFANEGYRAIAYSRRHNYPNTNQIRPNHSASLEADDLAALVRKLNLGKSHIVGHSYGAYTALFFALKYPDLARTVTLAEAPIVPWLTELPAAQRKSGETQWHKLMSEGVNSAKAAIESGDEDAAIRAMFDAIGGEGKFDSLPLFVKKKCRRNILELKAFLLSVDRYPNMDRQQVRRLAVPTLILSGSKSVATARLTDPELERLIPEPLRKRVVFPGATHIMWIEQPVRFRETVLEFIREQESQLRDP